MGVRGLDDDLPTAGAAARREAPARPQPTGEDPLDGARGVLLGVAAGALAWLALGLLLSR